MLILVDVDDVLTDFASPFLDIASKVTGLKLNLEDFSSWHIDSELFSEEQSSKIWDTINSTPGFISGLEIYPEAEQALKELRMLGTVVAVTAIKGPLAFYERYTWLLNHGFTHETIGFIASKQIVRGDVFIDDKPEHVNAWKKVNPEGLAFLWDRPNTQNQETLGIRTNSWDFVIDTILVRLCDKKGLDIKI